MNTKPRAAAHHTTVLLNTCKMLKFCPTCAGGTKKIRSKDGKRIIRCYTCRGSGTVTPKKSKPAKVINVQIRTAS